MKHLVLMSLTLTGLSTSFAAESMCSETTDHETPSVQAIPTQRSTSCLQMALDKFAEESNVYKSTLIRHYYTLKDRHEKINSSCTFYMSMVLMHVQQENYAHSYLVGSISWYQLIGLALAFDGYKGHTLVLKGHASDNEKFFTEVLDQYKTIVASIDK